MDGLILDWLCQEPQLDDSTLDDEAREVINNVIRKIKSANSSSEISDYISDALTWLLIRDLGIIIPEELKNKVKSS